MTRVKVQGIDITAVGLREAIDWVRGRCHRGEGGYFTFTGAHGVVEARRDPELRAALDGATANFADGMPVVWSARRRATLRASGTVGQIGRIGRVYGPDFMEAVFASSTNCGPVPLGHYLCGGGDGVAGQLAERLKENFPRCEIAGTHCPPFRPLTDAERRQLIRDIDHSGANMVWLGLSTPKQEKLAADLATDLPGRQLFAVGAAFDIHAGLSRSAPTAVQDLGLEWLWRLRTEPRRLLPRYLRVVPGFLWGEINRSWRRSVQMDSSASKSK